ncbi:MAG: 30S ribosomal protein S15 [Elusimicrobiaceae bacterium]|nr:30S ribosomal protein S15 [Elusimicrobiaceae bacterium]MBT3955420.1 30S ribosomal protein S15 [Elusimicrobiaceae bacterium]MBT4007697.1 30S ribosomal protein S15 [Elusimicrobiaceae bacterium]MBT4402443.1 30S ribosomal protein S15 [Elusimicrobiaceae bacterium]MBT4439847.1 30S ribosomal protein S15 [Elusimicrobiaceae bacterium]
MVLSKEDRLDVIGKFQKADKDTGSPSVQVALITERIKYLSDHLKTNKKDFSTERGLVKLVGQRKRLLAYLKKHNFDEYNKITRVLKIRK